MDKSPLLLICVEMHAEISCPATGALCKEREEVFSLSGFIYRKAGCFAACGPGEEKEDLYLARRESYEEKTEALLIPLLEAQQFELVDVEFVKEAGTWFLRAYIDKPGGITIDDCELVSRALSDRLDEKNFIEESYILEVSSPGLGRPLRKEKDFVRSQGESVEVKLFRALDKQKEFTGILKEWDKETVTLEFEDGAVLTVDRANIALIRLAFDF